MSDKRGRGGPVDSEEAANIEENVQNENGAEESAEAGGEQVRDLAAEYLEALQRERANFINYRRRTEQERGESAQYANSELLKKLLPVVDDFDRALAAIPEAERKDNRWVEGIELIARKLHTVLEQSGIEPIEALGQPFNPNLHEAVTFEDNATGDGDHVDTVAEVFAKGYKLRDRVLRPAMVKVTRG
ncbi:MAG TPA: nucleotide exchange factor GrpE [Chloroflexia bacterium]|nr:nucleotide exchange factor GrpE [Chloroflexia bacterium]